MKQEIEQEPLTQFLSSGGEILEFDAGGRPRKWLCGHDEHSQPTDPPGIDRKEVLRRLNSAGRWEGLLPTAEEIEEMRQWRSDWNMPT